MNYYFIAQIRIKNENEYHKYIDKSGDIFNKSRGEYLSVDNEPVILEGKMAQTPAVLPDKQTLTQ